MTNFAWLPMQFPSQLEEMTSAVCDVDALVVIALRWLDNQDWLYWEPDSDRDHISHIVFMLRGILRSAKIAAGNARTVDDTLYHAPAPIDEPNFAQLSTEFLFQFEEMLGAVYEAEALARIAFEWFDNHDWWFDNPNWRYRDQDIASHIVAIVIMLRSLSRSAKIAVAKACTVNGTIYPARPIATVPKGATLALRMMGEKTKAYAIEDASHHVQSSDAGRSRPRSPALPTPARPPRLRSRKKRPPEHELQPASVLPGRMSCEKHAVPCVTRTG